MPASSAKRASTALWKTYRDNGLSVFVLGRERGRGSCSIAAKRVPKAVGSDGMSSMGAQVTMQACKAKAPRDRTSHASCRTQAVSVDLKALNILPRRRAEQTAIFAAELRGTLKPNGEAGRPGVGSFKQYQAPGLLQPWLLLILQRPSRVTERKCSCSEDTLIPARLAISLMRS